MILRRAESIELSADQGVSSTPLSPIGPFLPEDSNVPRDEAESTTLGALNSKRTGFRQPLSDKPNVMPLLLCLRFLITSSPSFCYDLAIVPNQLSCLLAITYCSLLVCSDRSVFLF
jgi:hypothetical protein